MIMCCVLHVLVLLESGRKTKALVSFTGNLLFTQVDSKEDNEELAWAAELALGKYNESSSRWDHNNWVSTKIEKHNLCSIGAVIIVHHDPTLSDVKFDIFVIYFQIWIGTREVLDAEGKGTENWIHHDGSKMNWKPSWGRKKQPDNWVTPRRGGEFSSHLRVSWWI